MKLRLLPLLLLFTTIVFSQNYHDTQGKLEISNSGQAIYTLPIAMPPSIKDVGPVINLTYVSGQMGGVAGQGWNISTISNISRIATRKDIDGFVDGVDFDDNDKLALDGQRLILKTGTYWADSSTYETEVQSNKRIELKGSGTEIYFIVTTPDGSQSWYGGFGAIDSTAFYITKFKDTNNNYMTYIYRSSGVLHIDEIRFSANTAIDITTTNSNSIRFNYLQIERTESTSIKGVTNSKTGILKSVVVQVNNELFRKYELTHAIDEFGYQRVQQIQEYNGLLEPANPIIFTYNQTSFSSDPIKRNYNNNLDINNVNLSGDFDGDGRLDFVASNKLYTNLFNGSSGGAPIQLPYSNGGYFTATNLKNGKLNQYQSIVFPYSTLNNIEFKTYGLVNNTMVLENTKTIEISNIIQNQINCEGTIPSDPEIPPTSPYANQNTEYLEGDFNGDGISEVLIFHFAQYDVYGINDAGGGCIANKSGADGNPTCYCEYLTTNISTYSSCHYLNLDPNASVVPNSNGFATIPGLYYNRTTEKKYVADFNGDGKSDILIVNNNNGSYRMYGLKQLNVSPWVEVEILGEGTLGYYAINKPILFGDYNGDSKVDIMVPEALESPNWIIHYSNQKPNGGSFFNSVSKNIIPYHPYESSNTHTFEDWNSYYAIDINKDGKTDLVNFFKTYYQSASYVNAWSSKWQIRGYTNNIGKTSGSGFVNTYNSPWEGPWQGPSSSIPNAVASGYKCYGLNTDFIVLRPSSYGDNIFYYSFNKNVTLDNLLQKVTSSGGNIVDEIEYRPMEISTIYSSNNSLNYPNLEINNLYTNYIVSKLKNSALGIVRYQDFIYNGLALNMNGLGTIGFMNTARSAWYQTPSAKRIWNVTENNPLMRGATIRTYSQLFNTGNSFLFGTTTGLISSITNNFIQSTNNNVFKIVLNSQTTTDHITGVSNVINYSYDSTFALPISTETKNYLSGVLNGTITSTTEFENNATGIGNNYYIGRPKKSTTISASYGDTFQSSVEYFYTNNLLTKTKKKGNTTDSKYLVDDFEYDLYGNIKKKITSSEGYASPVINPRTVEFTYDVSGRFIKTSKDIEGLVTTNNNYNKVYGIVTSTTNPYGLTTTTEIDSWGKVKKITDYLGKSINYSYSKPNNQYVMTKIGDDGSESGITSDALGREILSSIKNIDGTTSNKKTEYDFYGRKIRESEPFLQGGTPLWSTITFDDYGRMITNTKATGLATSITYSGTTISGNDGYKSTSSTKNANGHVISSTDAGGTINFTYYASGNVKTSNFEGTIIAMEYDEWGAKTKLTDPSAGVYEYTYYPTGETKTEKTPKGLTTYKLEPATGKPFEKTILGSGTDSKTSYVYHPTTKILIQSIFQDNIENKSTAYTNTFDDKQRIIATSEDNVDINFNHEMSYDPFGRVEFEFYKSTLKANGKSSEKLIKNTYKNGAHWQILDNASGNLLWNTDQVNARGQLTKGIFGNGIFVTNTYDQYGYIKQNKNYILTGNQASPTLDILNLNTDFNSPRGNLMSRSNSMFNWNENFTYDNLDRLTSFKNTRGQQESQIYDNKGRITQNAMGIYKYDTPEKKYQNTSVDITPNAEDYYTNRIGVFSDGMENLSGWNNFNFSGASGISATITYDTSVKKVGNTSLKLSNNVTTGKVIHSDKWISINNQNPTTYTFSGWVYSDNPTAQMVLFMKTDNESGYFTQVEHLNTNVKNQWVHIVKALNIPANIKKINIRLDILGTGNVWFDDVKILKVADITADKELKIYYNAFKSPIEIEESGLDKIFYTYNVNNNRSVMYYGDAQATENIQSPLRKYYSVSENVEIKYNTITNQVEFLTYIGGNGYTAPIVLKSDGTTQEYLYLHRDYQGSILAITNSEAKVVEKRLFDAWGNIIKVEDGLGNVLNGLTLIDRGYTGHEHLQSVGLIHMNGRLYDPKLHRFLQPDNYVQDPYNSQNYNRYGYVLNNPLKYTDPSGEEITILTAIVISAIVGATTYTIGALIDNNFTIQGLIQASFLSALSGAVTFGIGTLSSGINNFLLRSTVQALAHGVFQGSLSGVQGGNFWSSFASASISSIASSAYSGGNSYNSDGSFAGGYKGVNGAIGGGNFGMLAFSTISGGAGAALTGGNFWRGAATAFVVSFANHYAHSTDRKRNINNEVDTKYGKDADNPASVTQATVDDMVKGLPTLNRMHANSQGLKLNANNNVDVASDGAEAHYYTNVEQATDASGGHYVELYRASFATYRHLAHNITHEFGHAFSMIYGNFAHNYASVGKNWSKAIALDELYAYHFAYQYGVPYSLGFIINSRFLKNN